MLSFLSPLFLAGAAAAAVPILVHLLKREPEPRVKFAAVKLLMRAPVEHTERRHIRELLLLALRVAALALLAFAFARPFFASGAALGSNGVTIVALDTSSSLSAPQQFAKAKQLAREAVGRAPSGDRVGLVTFADLADVAAPPTADRALVAAAIDQSTPGFGATRYRAALGAAIAAVGGGKGTVVVVTDLQESGWDAGDRVSVPESIAVQVADVGPPPPNLAVTAIRAAGSRLTASIRNTGDRARDTRVHLTLDGRPAGDTPVAVGPNATADVVLSMPSTAAAAAVSIDDPGGLDADNTRYTVLDDGTKPAVLIVTGSGELSREALYVQQALAAGGAVDAWQIAGVSAAHLSSRDEARLSASAAVVLLSTRGLERKGREALAAYLRSGGGVVIAAGPDLDAEVAADVLGSDTPLRIVPPPDVKPEERTLAPADVRHPVFQAFGANAASLGLVKFRTVARISGRACQPIARFTSGEPALLDCAAADGRALVVASDLNNRWNDFPLHATFVPFLHEAVRYVSGARSHAREYLVGNVPAGVPGRPGIATITDRSAPAPRARRVAVNVDPRESDPTRLSTAEFQSAITRLKDAGRSETRAAARQEEDRQHLWQYVLALMVAALAIEGVVAGRTA